MRPFFSLLVALTVSCGFLRQTAAQPFTEIATTLPGLRHNDAAWGDCDLDGDLDLLVTGYEYLGGGQLTRIYRNNGNHNFTDLSVGLPANWDGTVAWGDYDRDGDLDLLCSGSVSGVRLFRNDPGNQFTEVPGDFPTEEARVSWADFDNDGDLDFLSAGTINEGTRFYRNEGNDLFTEASHRLAGLDYPEAHCGDFDRDGDLDFALAGRTVITNYYRLITRIYRNDGNWEFTDIGAALEPLEWAGMAWHDFDNDGDLDLSLSGSTTNSVFTLKLYRNDDGSFADSGISFPGIIGSLAWGDYDQDGFADLLVCGSTSNSIGAQLFRNVNGVTFTNSGITLPQVSEGFWADTDGDGDLDLLFSGTNPSGNGATHLLRNDRTSSNPLPAAPQSLAATPAGNRITLHWLPGSDANQAGGHSFNLQVGTTLDGFNIVSPMSNPSTGRRRVAQPGLISGTNAVLDLQVGNYYWRVQAVDQTLAGSAFSTNASFVVPVQAPKATTQPVTTNQSGVLFITGDVNPNGAVTAAWFEFGASPSYGNTTAPQAVGGGTASVTTSNALIAYQPGQAYHYRLVASNSFGVTVGAGRSIVPPAFVDYSAQLPNLGNAIGPLAWADYDNDGDLDLTGNGSVLEHSPTGFVRRLNLYPGVNVMTQAPAWADMDGDGDVDLLLVGATTRLLRNDGGAWVEQPITMPGGYNPSSYSARADWGDLNQDGAADLVFLSTGPTLVYLNNQHGKFTAASNNLPELLETATAWADYDGDGDRDLAICGLMNQTNRITRLYRNDGDGLFSDISANLLGVKFGDLAWGDYDNDGDPDLALLGIDSTQTNCVLRLYRNDGSAGFMDSQIPFPGAAVGGLAWGDFNSDGWLDLAVSGTTTGTIFGGDETRLFQNLGGGNFATNPIILPGCYGRPTWGDFDQDGRLDLVTRSTYGLPQLFRNNIPATNPPPSAPVALSATITNNTVRLSWNAATDVNQSGGFTYNVRVGTATGKDVAVSGMAELTNGWRRVVRSGNADTWLSLPLTNAQWGGTYYWSVQAVDHGFAGSPFAPDATFMLPAFAPQALTLATTNVTGTTALLRGEAFAGGAETTVYFEFGVTTNYGGSTPLQIIGAEARWQPVGQTLSNLMVGGTYHYRLVAFSSVGTNFGANQSFITPQFVAATGAPTPWFVYDLAPGDYDGDGDLDYVLTFTENHRARLYRNEGNGTFTDVGIELPYSGGGTAAWGDFDNDGRLDLALGGSWPSGTFPAILRNVSDGVFVPMPVNGNTPDAGAILSWGDYDQDGDLDLLACASPYSTIYRNHQTNFVELGNIFTSLTGCAGTWGDFDNDGDLDVALTGRRPNEARSLLIYHNNGTGGFGLAQTLPGVTGGGLVAGDLDNDGFLDLMVSGSITNYYEFPALTTVYRNNSGVFAAQPTSFPPLINGRIALGDYNNDGRLDVLLRGTEGTYLPTTGYSNYARLWRNEGSFNFVDSGQSVDQMILAWADFDDDGKLDLVRTTSIQAVLYRNQNPSSNSPPTAPQGLNSVVSGNQVSLTWLAATDTNQTSPLHYNVRIGSDPSLSETLAPLAAVPNGYRQVVQGGNAQLRQNLTVRNLPGGNYFWSVQAVDHAFAGGIFSTQGVFTVTGPPTISDLTNQVTLLNTPTAPIPFQVTGLATSNTPLQITVTSSSPELIPAPNILLTGSGKHRTLTLTPGLDQSGTATITVRVTDMFGAFVTDSFTVTIEAFTALSGNFTPLYNGAGAWGDYDNDGDLDLLYHGMDSQSTPRTKLYRNNGGGSFTEISAGLPTVSYGSVAWGDYDRDGWLDVLVAGQLSGSSGVLRVYRNTGGGTFALAVGWSSLIGPDDAQWGDFDNDGDLDFVSSSIGGAAIYRYDGGSNFIYLATLPGSPGDFGSVAWSDYDLDGDLDVLALGNISNNYFTRLYRNSGNSTFADTGIAFPGVQSGDAAWGDYDNDGDPDLLLIGQSGGGPLTRIFRNDGTDSFTEINAGLLNLAEGSVAWGDYDNDGDLDVLLTGGTGSPHYTRVYRNDAGSFVALPQPLVNVADGAGVWGDYDNDGDLDFFAFGSLDGYTTNAARLYRNNATTANVPPLPPAGIAATVLGASATFQWPAGSDSNQLAGLTYNLRVGTAPGLANLVAPMSHPTSGARRLPAPGNAGTRLSHTITNLTPGTYYVSVQTVDHAFAGSLFSPETSFTITQPWIAPIPNQTAVPGQPLVVGVTVAAPGTAVNTLTLSATASDTNALPSAALVFSGAGTIRTLTLTPAAAASGTVTVTVTATDTNGGFWSVTFQVTIELFSRLITSLDGLTNDVAAPGDFDNDGRLDLFVSELSPTGRVSRLDRNLGNNVFADSGIALPAIERGEAVVWGDFNNDNYLDLALGGPLGGTNVIQILRNNAGNSFTRIASIGTGTSYNSRAAWGDFDQDGDLDIVIAAAGASLLYWNNGDESFTKSSLTLPAAGDYATVATADYDNDGDLDFILGGGSLASSWLYQNQGSGSFGLLTNFTSSYRGGLAWGDWDTDGDLDLALTGWAAGADVWLYRNESGNAFTVVSSNLAGADQGDLAWGDGDNDGDLDLLVSANEYWSTTRIYRNNGNNTFTDLEAGLAGLGKERVYWADLDGDGDLDVITAGDTFTSLQTYRTFLYRNNVAASNTPPTAPQNLTVTLLPENDVLLSWQPGSDAETTNGLSYNVRAGTTPGGIERITPEADLLTGMRRRAGLGNTGNARQLRLQNLPRGTNFWSVQTIDAAFAGSPFAAEVSFVITNGRPELSPIADQVALPGQSTGLIPFTVSDVETPAEHLVVTATSANQTVLPNANIQLSGTGTNRFLVLTPVVSTNVSTTVKVVLRDTGGLSVTNVFHLSVEPFSAQPLGGTPWTGVALWGDYDNDGDLDLLTGSSSGGGDIHQNNGAGLFSLQSVIASTTFSAAAWGDYDGDGDLDLLAMNSGNFTWLRRNNGNGSFTSVQPGLPVLQGPVLSWADYDNDGDLDIFLAGSTNSLATNAVVRLYRQTTPGQFLATPTSLPGFQLGTMAWADADNDGDLDVLLSGTAPNNTTFTRLYRNDGRGDFAIAFTFPSGHRSAAWSDYDQDGDFDLVLGGSTVTRIYRNDGSNVFTEVVNTLPGIADGVVAWGDYDSDGRADLLISGAGASGVYRNAGANNFTNIGAGLPGLYFSRAAWADADGDGDLDFALLGSTNQALNYVGAVFRNNFNAANTPPAAPAVLAGALTNGANNVLLTWSPASDTQTTNASGLHYNLRLGTTSGSNEVLPSHAAANGARRIVGLGNGGGATQWRLENLAAGTYYWSVQALDAAWAGSAFAPEASFTITNARPTLAPIQNLVLAHNAAGEVLCAIADADHAGADLTLNAVSSHPNIVSNAFVFDGTGTNRTLRLQAGNLTGTATVTVTVTDPAGAYDTAAFTVTVRQFSLLTNAPLLAVAGAQAWADYDRDGDLDLLLAGTTTNSCSYSNVTRLYRNEGGLLTNSGVILPNVGLSAVAWADYDRDGHLDFILAGQTNRNSQNSAITRLYRNLGNGTFALTTNSFIGMSGGAVAWGDYDNDGDADLLILGRNPSSSLFSALYRNNGTNSFTQITAPIVGGGVNLAASWADLDNDGDLDIVVTGGNMGTSLFRNNGNGSFSSVSSSIPAFSDGTHALGDYDNDGDLDILAAGQPGGGTGITRVYANLGNFNFTQTLTLPGVQYPSVAWGDFDNDGWRDILLTGASNSVSSRVLRSLGGTNFVELNLGLVGMMAGSATWADHDRDGDLDIALAGDNGIYYCGGNGVLTALYRNENGVSNTPPTAPTNLASAVSGRNVVLTWTKSTDVQTVRSSGLGYALRVGTNSGGGQIVSGDAHATGFRQTTSGGLTATNRWRLQNLSPGTYYWSVQAIDPTLAGSAFAPEAMFVITNTRPIANAQVIVMAEDSSRFLTLTGSDSDGQPLTFSLLSAPTNGSLTGTLPNLTYRPATNFFGGDSFGFQLSDGLTNSAPGAVLLVVTQVQDVATASLTLQKLADGQIRLRLVGEPYEQHRIEASQDLRVWTLVSNVTFAVPPGLVIDPDASNFTHRFYRSVWQPPKVALAGPAQFVGTQFRLQLAGEIGRVYRVQASTNLTDWQTLTNVILTNPITPFIDGNAFNFQQRFYRFELP